mgnify:FL=1
MNPIEVKIQRVRSGAVIPRYAKAGDAGMDLYAVEKEWDDHGNSVFFTGLAMEIPEGYVGLIFPRSSISKTPHNLRNSVGVIDSGYRGEIMVKFGGNSTPTSYKAGDRVAQIIIMPYPEVRFVESSSLSESDRGTGGFGSTGVS